ncbi:UDP-glucuronosyltransferase 2B14-like 5 [Homarus americanus]|uniref:UDP-glucuronosyltransferase n=1 Tax=Homarus americanus TaxID=6706 RepID=A0A8J5J7Y6_HOMAM|nr:UDP-glucuronosyltransferase 2B14-like 5 [Homarus americanus]
MKRSYNILIVLTVSGTSHRNVFIPVAEGLADRGHKVYVLSSLANFTTDRNITQLNTGINVMEDVKINTFDILEDNFDEFNYLMTLLPKLIDDVYASPIFMELYNKRKMFDLIIIDHMFNELNYPFTHEIPFITIATHGMDPLQSAAVFGNVLNPAYTPSVFFSLSPPKGLYQRFTNTLIHLLVSFTYNYWTVIPVIQKKMARNQSLTLINSHFSLVMPYPLLPSQVEVGALHCRPGQPLPQDISSWIEGAGEAGIVYFSLGSITKGALMPEKYLKLFLQAFKRLDQRVLWKFESDLPGVPDNILIRPWMPQQDILSHPGVKVFMSHGGLLGTQEALYHAKPILALPIHGDQPRNAQNIVDKGLGLSLNWKELSVDRIVHTIQEIINNPRLVL